MVHVLKHQRKSAVSWQMTKFHIEILKLRSRNYFLLFRIACSFLSWINLCFVTEKLSFWPINPYSQLRTQLCTDRLNPIAPKISARSVWHPTSHFETRIEWNFGKKFWAATLIYIKSVHMNCRYEYCFLARNPQIAWEMRNMYSLQWSILRINHFFFFPIKCFKT